MKIAKIIGLLVLVLAPTDAMGAVQEYYQGEAVFIDGQHDCIIQNGQPDAQGRYEVKCGADSLTVAPDGMVSNPDQTKTSRLFVCPGGRQKCYFKP